MARENELKMSFLSHLDDLRKHLFKAIVGIAAFSMVSFIIAEPVLEIISKPIGGLQNLQSIGVTENFTIIMKVSFLSGFIFSFPYTLFQILGFMFPALKTKEKRMFLLFFPLGIIFFVGGVLFAYYVMLPAAIPFLVGQLSSVQTIPHLEDYFSFTLSLIFWLGVSFESPLLILVLAKLKIVNAKMLLKNWRIAIVVIAILAAVITPTGDPINMGLFMAPLILLYLISILFAALV
ncbi:MAG: twin-arginine translocase subunit TatC [Anaerolineaceae bacterium]|nr:twin-arginine translocase subunit TatC [Anaerolineaceae bacterium]